jgi:hypothetical protein
MPVLAPSVSVLRQRPRNKRSLCRSAFEYVAPLLRPFATACRRARGCHKPCGRAPKWRPSLTAAARDGAKNLAAGTRGCSAGAKPEDLDERSNRERSQDSGSIPLFDPCGAFLRPDRIPSLAPRAAAVKTGPKGRPGLDPGLGLDRGEHGATIVRLGAKAIQSLLRSSLPPPDPTRAPAGHRCNTAYRPIAPYDSAPRRTGYALVRGSVATR